MFVELASVAEKRIETGLQKKVPQWEDLNPNRRFVNNRIIKKLVDSEELWKLTSERVVTWNGYSEIPRVLFSRITEWSLYNEYITSPEDNIIADRKFLNNLLQWLLTGSEDLLLHLEERSIYWNDDLDYAIMMVEKTFRKITEAGDDEIKILPLYKNTEDEEFAIVLLRNSLLRDRDLKKLIDSNTTNWEIERIALMDTLVMQLAIAEIISFPEIPVRVTLNEYIEIAKYYSTSKSSTFINGILDKVVREMRSGNMFEKTGRGLIGETEK
jgi:N utilization substance protein B